MKKRILIPLISLLATLGLLSWGYFAMEGYLQDRFGPNTWIGEIYCTGKTVEQVNAELLERLGAPVVTVTDSNGKAYSIDLEQTDFQYDYTEVLDSFQKNQREFGWISCLRSKQEVTLGNPAFQYDRDKLAQWWNSLPIVTAEETPPVLELGFGEDGYTLLSTLEGHLNVEKGFFELVNAVDDREIWVSLLDRGCYFDYDMTPEQESTYRFWEQLKAMERCGLTYDMGAEKIVFDEALMSRFIAKDEHNNPLFDENGALYYDREAVETYIYELCESYHTYGVKHDFLSSRGEIVQVEGVTYGTEIDTRKEQAYVWEYLNDEEQRLTETLHTPTYIHETPVHGLNDLGDTYIEVDMGEQKIYFYHEGELLVSSDIVTGNLKTKHGTPEGVNYIYGKYKNRVLRGPGYASFVRYWMPVYKAIGLHDARWRDEFGGEIYKTSGSHGCINLPDETADIIWEHSEIGIPVVMFY